jgi:prepilin-type N-terminal cleavage/methylation domain-containing protein
MPSRALNGRDPQQGEKDFSRKGFTGGFTLIEVMVVIAVVAIITSFALPSYRTLIEKRQVTSGAEQMGAFLSAVQMEAVKRSENITVSFDEDAWCVGIAVGTAACDCTDTDPATADCTIDDQVRIFNPDNLNYPDALSAMSDGSDDQLFVFDPARGLVYTDSALTDYDSAEFAFVSDDGTYALNVQVSATGRVKYCSDSDSTKVPGYDVCAN